MTDNYKKIDWYKEVLELEPNSKVFFPLARMLADEGSFAEAIKILQDGLERHEEFLEARLFLIELLYKNSMRDKCDQEVEKLNGMFSEYAGFWQAWAACLSSVKGDQDAASALNFLAAHFLKGKISFHEVINRGLAAILDSPQMSDAVGASAEICSDAIAPQASPNHDPDGSAAEKMAFAVDGVDEKTAENQDRLDATEIDSTLSAIDFPNENSVPESSVAEEAEPANASLSVDGSPGEFPDEDHAAAAEESLIPVFSETHTDVQANGEHSQALSDNDDMDDEIEDAELILDSPGPHLEPDNDGAEEGEERFSLRTRSMADVLAEQGDFNGALDIYQELHAAAISFEEKEDLEKCISLIESKIIAAQELEAAPPVQSFDEPGSGQDKLITMLEALAERVEARAQE